MRALVSGATGYLGGRLASRLASRGWRVHGLVRRGSPGKLPRGVRPAACDATAAGVLRLFSRVRPEAVFHVAARASARHAPGDLDALLESNVLLGARLAEASARTGVRAFVNAGTYWQHRSGRGYDPVSLYAAGKQAFEDLLRYWVDAEGLPAVTLKLFDVYGPDDPRGKLLALLRTAMRTGRALDLSPGGQTVDLVHVDDAAAAFEAAAAGLLAGRLEPGGVYAVGGGRRMTLKRLVALAGRSVGQTPPVRWGARPYRPREVMRPWSGPRLPGWRPKVKLEDGLREALA